MKREYLITLKVETEETEYANGNSALEELFSDQDLFTGECNCICDGESVNVTSVGVLCVDANPNNP